MRPKKIILLVEDNQNDLSTVRYMLATNGWQVLSASSPGAAVSVFAGQRVDLVLTSFYFRGPKGTPNGIQLIDQLKAINQHIPMLLLCDPQKMADVPHRADRLIPKKTCSALNLLEILRVVAARKRGPREGAVPTPAQLQSRANAAARRLPGEAGFSKSAPIQSSAQ